MHAVPLILCLLVVAVCAVPPHNRVARSVPNEWDSNSELVKRVLAMLDQEKRKLNFKYDPDNGELKVEYKVCVKGDKSEVPCRAVSGHKIQIFNNNEKVNKKVYEATEQFYLNQVTGSTPLSPDKTYTVLLTPDVHTLKACETDSEGKLIECNDAVFDASLKHPL